MPSWTWASTTRRWCRSSCPQNRAASCAWRRWAGATSTRSGRTRAASRSTWPRQTAARGTQAPSGRYLYAIRVYSSGETFDLCPADICRGVDGNELERAACPADAPKNGLRVEAYTPPDAIVRDVERIVATAGIDIGGIEYL